MEIEGKDTTSEYIDLQKKLYDLTVENQVLRKVVDLELDEINRYAIDECHYEYPNSDEFIEEAKLIIGFEKYEGYHSCPNGKSFVITKCPNCKNPVKVYCWNGKRKCSCGNVVYLLKDGKFIY